MLGPNDWWLSFPSVFSLLFYTLSPLKMREKNYKGNLFIILRIFPRAVKGSAWAFIRVCSVCSKQLWNQRGFSLLILLDSLNTFLSSSLQQPHHLPIKPFSQAQHLSRSWGQKFFWTLMCWLLVHYSQITKLYRWPFGSIRLTLFLHCFFNSIFWVWF